MASGCVAVIYLCLRKYTFSDYLTHKLPPCHRHATHPHPLSGTKMTALTRCIQRCHCHSATLPLPLPIQPRLFTHPLSPTLFYVFFFFFVFFTTATLPPPCHTSTHSTWYQNDRTGLLFPTVLLPPCHCHSPSNRGRRSTRRPTGTRRARSKIFRIRRRKRKPKRPRKSFFLGFLQWKCAKIIEK
jgi:hypothetical protein